MDVEHRIRLLVPKRYTLAAMGTLLACGVRAAGVNQTAWEAEAVAVALHALPLDSVCATTSSCRVVAIDPQIRRLPSAGGYDPYRYPVIATLSAAALPRANVSVVVVPRRATASAHGDTIFVSAAIITPVDERAGSVTVFFGVDAPSSYGIQTFVRLSRNKGGWQVRSIDINEG